jgi:hypothetical protein
MKRLAIALVLVAGVAWGQTFPPDSGVAGSVSPSAFPLDAPCTSAPTILEDPSYGMDTANTHAGLGCTTDDRVYLQNKFNLAGSFVGRSSLLLSEEATTWQAHRAEDGTERGFIQIFDEGGTSPKIRIDLVDGGANASYAFFESHADFPRTLRGLGSDAGPAFAFSANPDMGMNRGLAATWGFDSLVLQTSDYSDFIGTFLQMGESEDFYFLGTTNAAGNGSTIFGQTPIAGTLWSNIVMNVTEFTTGTGASVNVEANADQATGQGRFTITVDSNPSLQSITQFEDDQTTFTDPIREADGSEALPSYSFTNELDMGMWTDVDGGSNVELNFSVQGEKMLTLEENAGGTAQRMFFTDSAGLNVLSCVGTPGTSKECVFGSEGVGGQGLRVFNTTTETQIEFGSTGNTRDAEMVAWGESSYFRFDPGVTGTQYAQFSPLASYTGARTQSLSDASGTVALVNGTVNPFALVTTLATNNVDVANSVWGGTNSLIFEGATADANETTVDATDPTGDNTITLPDSTGVIQLVGHSGLSMENNNTTLSLPTSGSFVKVNTWETVLTETNATGSLTTDDITITYAGTYLVTWNIDFQGVTNAIDTTFTCEPFLGGFRTSQSSRDAMLDNPTGIDQLHLGGSALLSVTASQVVDLRCRALVNTVTIRPKDGQFIVTRIGP